MEFLTERAGSLVVVQRAEESPKEDFGAALRRGLTQPAKAVPYHFLYDARGSELFERITTLPEYYLTRVETAILEARAREIVAELPAGCCLVELGAGSSRKTRILIEALLAARGALRFVPIDISAEALQDAAHRLNEAFPSLEVTAFAGEYGDGLHWVADAVPAPRCYLWLGSSIGNLTHDEARLFLADLRSCMAPDDVLLLGFDPRKDRASLEAAYGDAQGVTQAFVLQPPRPRRRGAWRRLRPRGLRPARSTLNPDAGRVEIRLESLRAQQVDLGDGGPPIAFAAGEARPRRVVGQVLPRRDRRPAPGLRPPPPPALDRRGRALRPRAGAVGGARAESPHPALGSPMQPALLQRPRPALA
ncbi:MAG: L-histidine N(alpha)-methyltransferase [Planctomycetota bacterium]